MTRALVGAVVALGLGCGAGARDLQAQDWVGARLKVTGSYGGDRLLASRVQERSSGKDSGIGKIGGSIGSVDRSHATFRVGPAMVAWDSATRFRGLAPTDLVLGRSVEVSGWRSGEARLLAVEISPASLAPETFQLLGTITAARRSPDGGRLFTILGLSVEVPRRVLAQSSELTRNPNNRRPDRQLTIPLFGRPLTIGGEVGTSSRFRRGYRLDGNQRDAALGVEQQLQLELTYPMGSSALLFLTGDGGYEAEPYSGFGSSPAQRELKRGEMWVYVADIGASGLGIQLGRQNFREPREWWWGQDLDAIRMRYDRRRFHGELAVAQEVAPTSTLQRRIDPEEQGIRRWLGQVAWRWRSRQRIDAFLLRHEDRSNQPSPGALVRADQVDPADADLTWLGARVSGSLDLRAVGELAYWLDGAWVGGRERVLAFADTGRDSLRVISRTERRIDGWAVDGGFSWTAALPAKPTFTVGFAHGSGGTSRGVDRTFRQTGLQRNNDRFGGVDRFRYYGELLRPEVSNLEIWTVSGGIRPLRSSSLELLYHQYWQLHAAASLAGTRLDSDPLGVRHTIGTEWDVVLGFQEWEHIDVEIVGGLFRAGAAYGPRAGIVAHMLSAKVNLNF